MGGGGPAQLPAGPVGGHQGGDVGRGAALPGEPARRPPGRHAGAPGRGRAMEAGRQTQFGQHCHTKNLVFTMRLLNLNCVVLTPAQISAYLHVSAGGRTAMDGGASSSARPDWFPVPGRQVPGEGGGAARLPDLPAQHHPHHPGLAPQPHTPPPRHPATAARQHPARLSTAGYKLQLGWEGYEISKQLKNN